MSLATEGIYLPTNLPTVPMHGYNKAQGFSLLKDYNKAGEMAKSTNI